MLRSFTRCVFIKYKKKNSLSTMVACGSLCLIVYSILVGCCLVLSEFHPSVIKGRGSTATAGDNDEYETSNFMNVHHNRNLQETRIPAEALDWDVPVVKGDENIFVDEDSSEGDAFQKFDRKGFSENNGVNITRRLPHAIIIGVKKGGTRALLQFLRAHPDVQAAGPEPHFFDKNYDKGYKWYREQMPLTSIKQMTMEKTPSYFITKDAPKRIYNMSSRVKLIVVVRDPVTRAISDYTQLSVKNPNMSSFEKMAFIDKTSRLVDTDWAPIRIGVYAKHLEKWLRYFPRKQIHFVGGESLISDPTGEMRKVQQFLKIRPLITAKNFYINDERGFPCLIRKAKPHCLDKSKGRKHPDIDSRVLLRLRDFYRPFNAKFYQMVGHDFGWQ